MIYNNNSSLELKVSSICKNEYPYFLNKKNVVGVALGYKIIRGFCTVTKCITVFVTKKLSLNNLSRYNIIPKFFKGIQTDVVESGIFKFNSFTSRVRPVINGYSIGNILLHGSGTSGCLVHDKYNHIYILSCNHALAISNSAPLGSKILQPSSGDGANPLKDIIGILDTFIPIKFKRGSHLPENIVDCALCRVKSRADASPDIALIGKPKGVAKPHLNQEVQKVGRTTELTLGKIINLYGTIITTTQIQQQALFKNQITTTLMSSRGDSGSLLLTKDNYALGLLMSGDDNTSVYNPIDEVLKELKVQLVTL